MTELPKPLIYDQIIGESLSPSLRMISALVPAGSRVLDVGCASGYFSQHLAETRGCEVVGVDYSEEAVAVARRRGVDAYQIDLERSPLDSEGFDVAIFADVLEHLRDPQGLLASLRTPQILVSLPNITHWSARLEILRGRFPWADFGLFDRTHLRFFDRTDARQLIAGSGYCIASEDFNLERLPLEGHFPAVGHLRSMLGRRWPGMFAFQFILDARRSPAAA